MEVVEVVDKVRGAWWLWKGRKLKGAGWVAPADDRKQRIEETGGGEDEEGKKKSGKGAETGKVEKKKTEEGQ